jgi:glyoxylase-like metal-dependent hydrolase (beta-lactamase superfamily II)
MHIDLIVTGPIQTNCFVVHEDGQALVIDPGADAAIIEKHLADRDLKVVAYPVTHGHVDHVGALAEMYQGRPAPIGLHPKDLAWAFEPDNSLGPLMGAPARPEKVERLWAEGQTWVDGPFEYTIMETPGHSPGAVALYFPALRVLFPGDTLFQGSCGRTDLPGGNPRLLTESLKRLATLPDDTRVYPGHGGATTIGEEKRTNFFMRPFA